MTVWIQQLAHDLQKLSWMDGLDENVEVMTAGSRFLKQVFNPGLAGEEQDFASGMHGSDLNGDFDTIDSGHDYIAKENVGR